MKDEEKMFIKKVKNIPIRGKFRGKLFDEDKMSDIFDYTFDEIKGKFKDNYGIERNIYDYQYLYITNDILEDILKEVYENGLSNGFQKAKDEIKKSRKDFKKEIDR